MLTTHNIDIQAMLVWLTLPFYDFCGFWSVAVNTVYVNCSFFTFIAYSERNVVRSLKTTRPSFTKFSVRLMVTQSASDDNAMIC